MRIERIHIRNFLALAKADITFAPGLNVILAPNEGGKSSLMRAMIIGLYQDASSRRRELLAMRRWGSGTYPRIELWIEIGGERLRIVRDFDEHKQYLFRGDDADHFASGREVDGYLGERLVVPDERLFVRVCGVGQEDLARVGDGRIDLGERLEEILSGGWGGMSPAEVRGVVEEARADLRRGLDHPAKRENWGPLKRCAQEVEELQRSLSEARSVAERRAALHRTLSETRREREGVGLGLMKKRKERAAEYAAVRRAVEDAEKRMREIQQRKERLEKLLAERERLRERGNAFPPYLLRCDEPSIERIRGDIEREDILHDAIETPAAAPPAVSLRPLIAGGALVASGIAGWVRWGIVFAAVTALGLVLIVWTLARRRGGRAGPSMEQRRELERLERARGEWAAGRSLADSREMFDAFRSWRRGMRETDVRLHEMVGGGADARPASVRDGGIGGDGTSMESSGAAALLESLNGQFVELSAEWHASRGALEGLEAFRLDAEDLLRLERDIERSEQRAAELDERISSLEHELAALPAGEVNRARERLAAAREACDGARRRAAIVDIIMSTLDEARGAVAGFLAERLPPVAGRYLSLITDGRYRDVHVDPVTLGIEAAPAADDGAGGDDIAAPERISPDTLSRGARDQIYFAVRLAVVELLGGREPQPVLLDDTFVHFDPERRERARGVVEEFSDRHQVLLFSCDPIYGHWGESVLRL